MNVKGVIWTVQKAADGTGRLDHFECLDCCHKRLGQLERLQRHEGGGPLICADMVVGVIPTPGHEKTGVESEALASFMEYAASITPLARTGTDEEVAKVVAFLASDDSSFITASEVFADGGLAQI